MLFVVIKIVLIEGVSVVRGLSVDAPTVDAPAGEKQNSQGSLVLQQDTRDAQKHTHIMP
jgi:hypothetical protein